MSRSRPATHDGGTTVLPGGRLLGAVLRDALQCGPTAPLQLLSTCTTQVQHCSAQHKDLVGLSRVTFLTEHWTERERRWPEVARYVGVVVWVPRELIDE